MDHHYLNEIPAERDHPDKIEAWIGRYGAPPPTGATEDLDDAFHYAGMIWAWKVDAHAVEQDRDITYPGATVRREPPAPIRMTLAWEFMPPWLGLLIPGARGSLAVPYIALVLQSPAEGRRGYAGRVGRHGIAPRRGHHDATLTVEATHGDTGQTMQWWSTAETARVTAR